MPSGITGSGVGVGSSVGSAGIAAIGVGVGASVGVGVGVTATTSSSFFLHPANSMEITRTTAITPIRVFFIFFPPYNFPVCSIPRVTTSSGFFMLTFTPSSTELTMKVLPAIVALLPITVSPPRTVVFE